MAKPTATKEKKKITKKVAKGGALNEEEVSEDEMLSDSDDQSTQTVDAEREEIVENLSEIDNEDALEDHELDDALEGSERDIDEEKGSEKEDFGSDDEKEDYDADECLYKFTKKKREDDDEDDDFEFPEDDHFDDDNDVKTQTVPNDQRQTKPVLTIFERANALGVRARQLSLGAKSMLKGATGMDPKTVAKLELKAGVMPFFVERTLPGGKREKWKISELKIVN
jgi:DNA-directed RNA polymerase subunit K/omega